MELFTFLALALGWLPLRFTLVVFGIIWLGIFVQTRFFPPSRIACDHFLRAIVGHRGGASGAPNRIPENTIPAFKYALEHGVTTVEFDVQMTKDNVLVVFHDPYIGRTLMASTGDASKSIHDFTLKEIKAMKFVSELTSPEFKSTQVPTFQETLDFCVQSGLRMMIEIKRNPKTAMVAEAIAKEIARRKIEHMCYVASFDPLALLRVRWFNSGIATGYLVADSAARAVTEELVRLGKPVPKPLQNKLFCATLDSVLLGIAHPLVLQFLGISIVAPHVAVMSTLLARKYHAYNIPVLVWTVNRESEQEHMFCNAKVSVITDFPMSYLLDPTAFTTADAGDTSTDTATSVPSVLTSSSVSTSSSPASSTASSPSSSRKSHVTNTGRAM